MSSMIKDIQSIINNNVSEFIRILSDRYELDIDELNITWGDISLGKENKKSNDVKTIQKQTKKQIEKEEEDKEEEEEEENIDTRDNSSNTCPYKFSKGVRQGEICGIKSNKGTHCSKHKKYENDVPVKTKNSKHVSKPAVKQNAKTVSKTESKPEVKQNAKTDSKPVSKPDSKPDSNYVTNTEVKNNITPISKTYAKPITVSDSTDNLPDYLKARTGDLKSLMNTNILEFVKYKRAPFMYNSVTGLILKSNKDTTVVAKVVDNILLPLQESEIKLCESRNFKYDTKFYFDEIYDEEISEKVLESTSLPESILQLFKIIKNQLCEDSCNEKTETIKQVEEVQEEEKEVEEEVEEVHYKFPKLSHISALEAIEKIKESILESSESEDDIITRKDKKKTHTKTNSKKDITSDSDSDNEIITRKQGKKTITKTSSKRSSKKDITSDSESDNESITRKDKKKTHTKTNSKKDITSDSDSDEEIITRKQGKKTITKTSSKTSSKKDITSDSDSDDEIITRRNKKKTLTKTSSKTSSKKDITSDSDDDIITRKKEKQYKPKLSQGSCSIIFSEMDRYLGIESSDSETENNIPNRNIDKSKYVSATEYIKKNSVNDSDEELKEELELEEDEE